MSDLRTDEGLREQALERVRKRRDFWPHLLVYVMVNALVVAVWFMTGQGGFFWPIFLIAGWGIGVVMHAWDAFYRTQITEEDIDREITRMQHH
jgi:uncharacterized membrane protein